MHNKTKVESESDIELQPTNQRRARFKITAGHQTQPKLLLKRVRANEAAPKTVSRVGAFVTMEEVPWYRDGRVRLEICAQKSTRIFETLEMPVSIAKDMGSPMVGSMSFRDFQKVAKDWNRM